MKNLTVLIMVNISESEKLRQLAKVKIAGAKNANDNKKVGSLWDLLFRIGLQNQN